MRRLRIRAIVALLTFAGGILAVAAWHQHQVQTQQSKVISRNAEELNISELLFHDQFQEHSDEEIYFLAFNDGEDFGDEFMKRFSANGRPVKKQSQSMLDTYVIDKETGKTGVRLGISRITWLNEVEVKVGVSCFNWGWGQRGYGYRVVRENNKWVIKSKELSFIT